MTNMRIEHCAAAFGGAVYATASGLKFNGTAFVDNSAIDSGESEGAFGGAVFADGSTVYWSGQTTFSGNIAASTSASLSGGGALTAIRSHVYWDGETGFVDNAATGGVANGSLPQGGALYVYGSNISWSKKTSFSGYVVAGEIVNGEVSVGNIGREGHGGALFILQSNLSWSGETNFSGNIVAADTPVGGAAYVGSDSIVSWSGETVFANNGAGCVGFLNNVSLNASSCEFAHAGALSVFAADVSWTGDTIFSHNVAAGGLNVLGGALVILQSNLAWSGETVFSSNAAAGVSAYGSALATLQSNVSWDGETSFSTNYFAPFFLVPVVIEHRSALYTVESNVSWSAETTFSNNTGSALAATNSSDVSWTARTTFLNNIAGGDGGALIVDESSVSWGGETAFAGNMAGLFGGALRVGRSSVSWSGETAFSDNTANYSGGALSVDESSVSWNGETAFSDNTAHFSGGALSVDESSVSWSGETAFSDNTATSSGGALYVSSNSTVSWDGVTSFSHNSAGLDGGAIFAGGYSVDTVPPTVRIAGTTFSNNWCEGSGGALALVGEADVSAWTSVFEGNTAEISGGAVFISDVGRGPEFVQANFSANISPQGGAVYSVSSGTEVEITDEHPVAYTGCFFTGNRASTSGGAIESLVGNDEFLNSSFEGNAAGVGGAMRLSGSTSVKNCEFIDNVSDEDEGAAVSMSGAISMSGVIRFAGNDFWCENGTYLDSVSGDRWSKVCDGCDKCPTSICDVEDANSAPVCSSQLEHTRSEGGDTTVETLEVSPGYWRATPTSSDVLACYNEYACLGGLTGSQGFCQEGYEGPYCSVCSEEYAMTLSFTCTECVDTRGGIAIMAVVAVFSLCAVSALLVHLVSGEVDGARQGLIHRVTKRLPLQSIKIVVVVWQILTQFTSVANVAFPRVYQRFLDGVNFLNFDVLLIPSIGCIMDVDFHDRLLMSTIGPLVSLTLLAATFSVARRRNRGSETALERVRHKHMSMVLLISFLVYSSVSATVFQTFACESLDDGNNYLRADYRIDCDSSKHRAFEFFAFVMVAVYPVGIPLFYGYLLYKNRRVLASESNGVARDTRSKVQPISDLWVPYKPRRFYYEVIECMRRIMLTGVVVFIYPNTAAQVAVTLMIAFLFVALSLLLAPYVSKWDAGVSLVGHLVVFTSMYMALLSKVDVSDERDVSQEVFAGVLVAAHACMVVAVVLETAIIFHSMGCREGPR